ncbi:MAG TPA: TonB-dependent receptor plug domain-containing protein, partial [bacterium]|nr:TonB-dependent receptor plug domain-containing protein [bacterium]
MLLPVALLASCVVDGSVTGPAGTAVEGADVLHAATGARLAVTDASGAFHVEAPETGDGETVLEIRHPDMVPVVRRLPCGSRLTVRMRPLVYQLETVTVQARRLAPAYDGSAIVEETLEELVDLRDAEGGGATLAQAVQQLPGVGAVGRDGLTSAPTIRGMGRDRSLILLEGVRLSSDRGVGPTASFLDPFLLGDVSV